MVSVMDRLAAAQAAPLTHRVTTTYADGAVRSFDTRSAGSAETYAVGERRKIGKKLIDRATGETVCVTDVTISEIA